MDPYLANTSSLRCRPPQLKGVGVDFQCRLSEFSKKSENSLSQRWKSIAARHGTGTRHGTCFAVPCRKSKFLYGTARHVPRGTRGTIFSHHFIKFCIINISSFPILYGPILSIYINLSIIIYNLLIIIFFLLLRHLCLQKLMFRIFCG